MLPDAHPMSRHNEASDPGALGPMPVSDGAFMRRIRIHQAWYRTEVPGKMRYGALAGSGHPCGSVLAPEDADAMLNFHGSASVAAYLERREHGWGVDPVRCTQYMTSSQTLTFNMLGEVSQRPAEGAAVFNALLGRSDLAVIERMEFEFSAVDTPYWIGDRTLLDAAIWFRTAGGGLQVVGIETKLADRFSLRRPASISRSSYAPVLAARPLLRDATGALDDNRTRQLARCHALAQSIQLSDGAEHANAVLVLLVHPDDAAAQDTGRWYGERLATRSDAVVARWDEYLRVVRKVAAMDDQLSGELLRRYVDLELSAHVLDQR